jgi:hypothetical protein
MAKLIAEGKANGSYSREGFGGADAFLKYVDSVSGKRVVKWKGWAKGIHRGDGLSLVSVVMTDPKYLSEPYPDDVYLNDVSLVELGKLRLWQHLTPPYAESYGEPLQYIKFSGTIMTVDDNGDVALIDVSLQPLN